MHRSFLLVPLLAASLLPQAASAGLWQRCQEDQLTNTQAKGRNAWSRKCGYITTQEETELNSMAMYAVYNVGKYGGNPNIPIDVNAGCVGGIYPIGACKAGCYTPDQSLEFEGMSVPIEEAYESGVETVTALTKKTTLGSLEFGEQKIEAFIAGETTESIFYLRGANGASLAVTSEHPMVMADGSMVVARELQVGDELLDRDGELVELVAIDVAGYEGFVWNVQPLSTEKAENILVAQGFLTGSVRFQNEWADDLWRLMRRQHIRLPAELRG